MAIDIAESVEIGRPPEEVFDYLAHAENMPLWMAEFESVEQVSAGPPAKGTTYQYKMATRGKAESTFEWSEFDPARKLAWHGERVSTGPGSLEPSGEWVLEEHGGSTRLTMRMKPKTGGLMTLMSPLMARSIRKGAPANMKRLKDALEGGAA
jgi:uncharacterized protein YndB with AHSA1/START domain